MSIEERIRTELDGLESRAQLRDLRIARQNDFCSNDYLGLATDPRMKQALQASLASALRIASTGSRLLSGHDEAWDVLEKDFAQWVGAEAALYFSSGYAANMGLFSSVLRAEDVIFSDSENHASIIDGIRLAKCRRVIFPHLDLNALEEQLRSSTAGSSGAGLKFIVVESIFSMTGDRAPLAELASIAKQYHAELIVDEAHAVGVYGPHGAGCVSGANLASRAFATVHTCGKALASAGAFVCGSESLRRLLINRARSFIFSTALPAYFASQVTTGMRLASEADPQRAHLSNLSNLLRTELAKNSFAIGGSDSHIVPVVLGSNDAALAFASHLGKYGYGIRAIRPPTVPEGTSRLRISLTANLSTAQVINLAGALVEVRDELALARAAR